MGRIPSRAMRSRRRRAGGLVGARRWGLPRGSDRSSRQSTTAGTARTRLGSTGWGRGAGQRRRAGKPGRRSHGAARRRGPDRRNLAAGVEGSGRSRRRAVGADRRRAGRRGTGRGVVCCKGPGWGSRRIAGEGQASRSLGMWVSLVIWGEEDET